MCSCVLGLFYFWASRHQPKGKPHKYPAAQWPSRHTCAKGGVIKGLDANAVVGYRGSLVTGTKFKTGGPFNPSDFDVDAYIVSDKLASQFKNGTRWMDGRKISEIKDLSKSLEETFKTFPGYRADKPFTFRIWSTKEFAKRVQPTGGYKNF